MKVLLLAISVFFFSACNGQQLNHDYKADSVWMSDLQGQNVKTSNTPTFIRFGESDSKATIKVFTASTSIELVIDTVIIKGEPIEQGYLSCYKAIYKGDEYGVALFFNPSFKLSTVYLVLGNTIMGLEISQHE